MKSTLTKIALNSLLIILLIPNFSFSETKTFIKEYTYQAGAVDSKNSSRTIALREVKRLLLEELGTYLESITDVQNFKLTKDQITTLSAGIVQIEIVDEKWDDRSYWLKSQINADLDYVVKSIDALRKDRQKIKELEDVRKQWEDSLKEIERLRQEPTKATSEKKQKETKAYNKAIEELDAIQWFETGYLAQMNKRWKEAVSTLSKAIKLNPKLAEAYGNRGFAYEKLGNIRRAIEDYDKVIELNPKNAMTYNNWGIAYSKLGNHKQAIKGYNEAIDLDPQYANAYGNRGIAYSKLGNHKQAISDFDKAIELNPQLALAYYLKGVSYRSLGNQDQANRNIKIAAELGHKKAQDYLTKKGIDWTEDIPSATSSNELAQNSKKKDEPSVNQDKPARKPEKKAEPLVNQDKPARKPEKKAEPSIYTDNRYKGIKAIVLYNGDVIEGRIISMNAEIVKIHTKEGSILSYSFANEIREFIKE